MNLFLSSFGHLRRKRLKVIVVPHFAVSTSKLRTCTARSCSFFSSNSSSVVHCSTFDQSILASSAVLTFVCVFSQGIDSTLISVANLWAANLPIPFAPVYLLP